MGASIDCLRFRTHKESHVKYSQQIEYTAFSGILTIRELQGSDRFSVRTLQFTWGQK